MSKSEREIVDTQNLKFEDTQKNKFLTFALGKEFFAIEILHVVEIIGIQNITAIPDVPGYVKGIINLRGKIIPVMDMRIRFEMESIAYGDRTCIIVLEVNQMSVGIIVDEVAEVVDILEHNIMDTPEMNEGRDNRFLKKLGKVNESVMLIIDCEKIFAIDDIKA